jgi:flagellum-specific peptidoglycan hydrolase FlgJ
MSTLDVEITIQRKGRPKAVLEPLAPCISRLTRLMALAIRFQDMVDRREVRDYAEIARLGYVTRARLSQIMNLLLLAPDIQEEVLGMKGQTNRNAEVPERDMRAVAKIALWRQQKRLWVKMKGRMAAASPTPSSSTTPEVGQFRFESHNVATRRRPPQVQRHRRCCVADREQRLDEVAHIAVALEVQTGCPAQLLVAQRALESQWGSKPAGQNNYFGIKAATRHKKCCTVTTREVVDGKSVVEKLKFADYDSLEDSCRDYAWLITNGAPYRADWGRYQSDRDLHALIAIVARTYATDPNYATLAWQIANQANVTQALTQVDQKVIQDALPFTVS